MLHTPTEATEAVDCIRTHPPGMECMTVWTTICSPWRALMLLRLRRARSTRRIRSTPDPLRNVRPTDTHTHAHARTHTRTHARTHARTHTHRQTDCNITLRAYTLYIQTEHLQSVDDLRMRREGYSTWFVRLSVCLSVCYHVFCHKQVKLMGDTNGFSATLA